MKRREFIAIACGAIVAGPSATRAEGAVRRVGVIMNFSETDPEGQARVAALRNQLRKLGWTTSGTIQLEVRWAASQPERMHAYTAELVRLRMDVIVANSTPLISILKAEASATPLVFTQVADPVGSGFVSGLAQPGGNITGFADFDLSVAGKWVEILKEAVPSLNQAIVLADPDQSNHSMFLRFIEDAGQLLKVDVTTVHVRNRLEIAGAIAGISGRSNAAMIVLPGPVNNDSRRTIIESTARQRLPAIYPFRYYATDGGLLYYGLDQIDQWTKAAGYVDRILRGESAGELPVQQPTKFELVVNLKTAKATGISIPSSILSRANDVIE